MMSIDYAKSQLEEARRQTAAARAALAVAKTKKAANAAYDDIEFWTNKAANMDAAVRYIERTA